MLVMTRRVGEASVMDGKQVKVGIHAPKEVPVFSEELLDRATPSARA